MYKLNVTSHFSSAHKLDGYDGACKNLHGHNWKVRIGIICSEIDNIGMTIDYGIVKNLLEEVIDELDHSYLNDLHYFSDRNPTSENIAEYIFKQIKQKLKSDCGEIADVEVWESERTSMVYFEN